MKIYIHFKPSYHMICDYSNELSSYTLWEKAKKWYIYDRQKLSKSLSSRRLKNVKIFCRNNLSSFSLCFCDAVHHKVFFKYFPLIMMCMFVGWSLSKRHKNAKKDNLECFNQHVSGALYICSELNVVKKISHEIFSIFLILF